MRASGQGLAMDGFLAGLWEGKVTSEVWNLKTDSGTRFRFLIKTSWEISGSDGRPTFVFSEGRSSMTQGLLAPHHHHQVSPLNDVTTTHVAVQGIKPPTHKPLEGTAISNHDMKFPSFSPLVFTYPIASVVKNRKPSQGTDILKQSTIRS